jgi:FixJ family two-component response regulator
VALGRLNKQIAFDLGISEVTVKLHRGSVMRKMQAASVGELIRAWEALPADMREA